MNSIIEEHLGLPGALLTGSKSGYMDDNPRHLVQFNANVIAVDLSNGWKAKKVWYGDLDLSDSFTLSKLVGLSNALGMSLYVLPEMAARFENEQQPDIEEYSLYVNARLNTIRLSDAHQEYFELVDGTPLLKEKYIPNPTTEEDMVRVSYTVEVEENSIVAALTLPVLSPVQNPFEAIHEVASTIGEVEDVNQLVMHKDTGEKVHRILLDYLISEYPEMNNRKLAFNMSMAILNSSPVYSEQNFIKPGRLYIREI